MTCWNSLGSYLQKLYDSLSQIPKQVCSIDAACTFRRKSSPCLYSERIWWLKDPHLSYIQIKISHSSRWTYSRTAFITIRVVWIDEKKRCTQTFQNERPGSLNTYREKRSMYLAEVSGVGTVCQSQCLEKKWSDLIAHLRVCLTLQQNVSRLSRFLNTVYD